MAARETHMIQIMAAIDFGTTYSGYAYSYQHNQDKVYVNSYWPDGSNRWKVPTAILFDENQKFVAFGGDAENRFCRLAESEKEHLCYYFKHFKMMLYEKKKLTPNSNMMSVNGKNMKAIDVFSGSIKYLKDHLIRALNERNAKNDFAVDDIMWVLTTPAIWSDAAKQFMREAAEKAGIPREHLIIGLEPECASIHCRTLPDGKLPANVQMDKVGVKYMVLDCGGGTIDVTVHEILEDGKLKEVYKATGGAWGGEKINSMYEDFLKQIVGEEVINRVKTEHKSDWVSMLRDFEQTKRTLSTQIVDNEVVVKVECCVSDVYEEIHGINLQRAFQINKINGQQGAVLRKKTRLQIPSIAIFNWIETVCQNVRIHVEQLIEEIDNNISFIVMVGGFSNSSILQDEIKSVLEYTPVFVPEEAELSVVMGAVRFGWNPNVVTARRSKYSYGRSVYTNFLPLIHPEARRTIDDDGKSKCKVFAKFVEAMQEVKVGDVIAKTSKPYYHNQDLMVVRVYYSADKDVKYIDEPGCYQLGKVRVHMPDLSLDKSREVNVCCTLGETELRVDAEDVTTGGKFSSTFDFFSE